MALIKERTLRIAAISLGMAHLALATLIIFTGGAGERQLYVFIVDIPMIWLLKLAFPNYSIHSAGSFFLFFGVMRSILFAVFVYFAGYLANKVHDAITGGG